MRKLMILAMGACVASVTAAQAASFPAGTHSARVEAVMDEDYLDGSSTGVKIGYGVYCDENYELGLLVMFEDDSDIEQQSLGLSIEQNFPVSGCPFVPFLGAAAGYHWLDGGKNPGVSDRSSPFVQASAGAKLFLTDWVAVSASAEYSWANKDVYLDDDGPEGSNLEFAVGLRFYF